MAGTQRLLAIAMTYFLAGVPGSGRTDVLGIVVQAHHANLGSHAVSEGTTVYEGDRLSTDPGGTLQVRSGEVMLRLKEASSVVVRDGASVAVKEFRAELVSGSVELSAAEGVGAEIVACGARIRPAGNTAGVIQVRVLGEKELVIFARRGSAQFSYHDESATIAEGKTYRVVLDPADDRAPGDQTAKKPGRPNKAFLLIAGGIVPGVVGVAIWKALESPDRP